MVLVLEVRSREDVGVASAGDSPPFKHVHAELTWETVLLLTHWVTYDGRAVEMPAVKAEQNAWLFPRSKARRQLSAWQPGPYCFPPTGVVVEVWKEEIDECAEELSMLLDRLIERLLERLDDSRKESLDDILLEMLLKQLPMVGHAVGFLETDVISGSVMGEPVIFRVDVIMAG